MAVISESGQMLEVCINMETIPAGGILAKQVNFTLLSNDLEGNLWSSEGAIELSVCCLFTAVASFDYESVDVALEFSAGSADGDMRCINVIINEDLRVEGNETFAIELFLLTDGSRLLVNNTETTVTILDEDGKVWLQRNSMCVCTFF